MSAPLQPPFRYDPLSIALHWAVALLILVLFLLGWYMVDLPKGSAERSYFFSLHKSVGLTVASLVVVRIAWRARQPEPVPVAGLAQWQRRLAAMTHRLLYVFMIVQPLTGYLSASFSGYPTGFWGVPLPQWADKDPVVNEIFTGVHVLSSKVLLALIVLHTCGALSHLWSRHENVLRRMLPGPGGQQSETGTGYGNAAPVRAPD
ncbi:MAG: cytochrome b [Gammaproteobacteria bacterium]|nr:cytochrome b [Gammaproteobacteria bacterium]